MSRAFSTLEAVPSEAAVFVDANIFLYHFFGASSECAAFLERSAGRDVRAVTGIHIVAEVLHRLMIAEALAKRPRERKRGYGEAGKGFGVRYLEAHPDEVRRLADYLAAEPAIERMVGNILPLTIEVMRASLWARSRHGLLINDSLTAAMMKAEGIVHLASNDAAFLRLDGITVHRPTDLESKGVKC